MAFEFVLTISTELYPATCHNAVASGNLLSGLLAVAGRTNVILSQAGRKGGQFQATAKRPHWLLSGRLIPPLIVTCQWKEVDVLAALTPNVIAIQHTIADMLDSLG